MAKSEMTNKEMLARLLYRSIRYKITEVVEGSKQDILSDLREDTGVDFEQDETRKMFDALFDEVVDAAVMGVEGASFDRIAKAEKQT